MKVTYSTTSAVLWTCVLAAVICGTPVARAERFLLQVPGQPNVSSEAERTPTGLSIRDATGATYVYTRVRQYDSADGAYHAYFCRSADRYVRWPVSGRGVMYLGTAGADRIAWRPSRMQVVPRRPAMADNLQPGLGRPLQPLDRPLETLPPERTRTEVGSREAAGPTRFAAATAADGQVVAAALDAEGQLSFYTESDERWQRWESELAERFDPASSLTLVFLAQQALPDAYLVDGQGTLRRVSGGRVTVVDDVDLPDLAPYANLSTHPAGRSPALHTVPTLHTIDRAGDLWELDVRGGHYRRDGSARGQLVAGAPVTIAGSRDRYRFAVDRQGRLMQYGSELGDSPSRPGGPAAELAAELVPGSRVAATVAESAVGPPTLYLAALRQDGGVLMLQRSGTGWTERLANDIQLPHGSDLALFSSNALPAETLSSAALPGDGGIRLSAITGDGAWRLWRPRGADWVAETISEGFVGGGSVGFYSRGSVGFAVDRRGRLVAAEPFGERWRCCLCSPQFLVAPQLVSRRIVPNPAPGPARVILANSHDEELVARIYDRRAGRDPVEVSIQPGESWTIHADRDSGAVWEEVFLVPGPLGTLVEQVQQWPVPPQSLYEIVVYVNRVTSVYFDRTTNRSNVPDSAQTSLVSLGVFPLPPGPLLRDGETIDVYAQARRQGNPGAAAWYGRP